MIKPGFRSVCHPQYRNDARFWLKWRTVYEGGSVFIEKYLERFSKRESSADFNVRRRMSYSPAFAKAAIVDIRNSIYQRLCEVRRVGPQAYLETMEGKHGGVDLQGRSISNYLGTVVLDELLTMARVALWVDNVSSGNTKATKSQPYLTMFKVEDIRAWDTLQNPQSILLRETMLDAGDYGLVTSQATKFRLATVVTYADLVGTGEAAKLGLLAFNGKKVLVKIFGNDESNPEDWFLLDMERIPVVIAELSQSLLKDVADYQIALLNLASSDLSYTLKANFPFYTEQYVPGEQFMFNALKGEDGKTTSGEEASIGPTTGRKYAKGMDRPEFIAPPTEPLKASMEKQDQLKKEIRLLVNLALTNISPTRSSRESKDSDNQSLEAGLSYIAQELERVENLIGSFWVDYLGSSEDVSVTYPDHYSLKSDEQLLKEANDDLDLADKLPSLTAKKALVKRATTKALRSTLDTEATAKVHAELEALTFVVTNPDSLRKDVELGLVSVDTASKASQYPEGEAVKAKEERVERMAATALAQSQASAAGAAAVTEGASDATD